MATQQRAHHGIIPAYAGSTSSCRWLGRIQGSSPHTRGARRSGSVHRAVADHPRIRGEHATAVRASSSVGIIPAYAGSTRVDRADVRHTRDHPRIRGEHRATDDPRRRLHRIIPAYAGSTPVAMPAQSTHGIIPAYAGSTAAGRRRQQRPRDHPRIRGEHQIMAAMPLVTDHPRIRGEHSTYRSHRTPMPRDHPRIRGEHRNRLTAVLVDVVGSSPHTRGAPVDLAACRQPVWDHPRIRGEHLASAA